MKIEIIEENKIRVVLTHTELEERNLTPDNLKKNTPYLNEFLFEIMEHIREETGFNPYNGQVVVEAAPENEGLVLMVTKLTTQKRKMSLEKKKQYINAKPKRVRKRKNIYIFNDFEDLCGAVMRLDKRAFDNSSLYKLEGKFYYYLIQGAGFEKSNAILSEYSERFGKMCSKAYLEEHGNKIFEHDGLYNMALNLLNCE